MGQWLSIPLVLAGIVVVTWALRRPPLAGSKPQLKAVEATAIEPKPAGE